MKYQIGLPSVADGVAPLVPGESLLRYYFSQNISIQNKTRQVSSGIGDAIKGDQANATNKSGIRAAVKALVG